MNFPSFLKTALPPLRQWLSSYPPILLYDYWAACWVLQGALLEAAPSRGPHVPRALQQPTFIDNRFLFHLIVFGISTHVFCVKTYPEPYSSFGSIYSRRVSGGKGGTSGKAEASSSTLRVFSSFFLTSWKYQENGFKNYAFFPTKKIFLLWKFGHFFNEL